MLEWVVAFAGAIAVSASIFVAVAVLWLRKLRETVSGALTEASARQLINAQQVSEAVSNIQKQQRTYEQQLHSLAQAGVKLRQDLAQVTQRLEHVDYDANHRSDRTVH